MSTVLKNKNKQQLVQLIIITWIVRLLPLVLLFVPNPASNIADFYKVLFFMIWDSPDCSILKLFGYNVGGTCYFKEYQIMDKASDLLTYLVLLAYFFKKRTYSDTFLSISMILFIIRAVGVFSFVKTGNSNNLVKYPDFLREFLLIYLFFQDIYPGVSMKWQMVVYFISVIFKIKLENVMHSRRHLSYHNIN